MTALLDMWSPGRLPAVNTIFNAKMPFQPRSTADLLRFMERMVSVDKSMLEGVLCFGR